MSAGFALSKPPHGCTLCKLRIRSNWRIALRSNRNWNPLLRHDRQRLHTAPHDDLKCGAAALLSIRLRRWLDDLHFVRSLVQVEPRTQPARTEARDLMRN